MFQVYSVCMHAYIQWDEESISLKSLKVYSSTMWTEKARLECSLRYKKGHTYNNLLHWKKKINAVIYTLCIKQLMTGAYQALMQGVGVFGDIITKCISKGKSSSHICLFLQIRFYLATFPQEAH